MGIVSAANAQHYRWGRACDGCYLPALDEPGVSEERMPPGNFEQWRRQARARQFLYVLDGELARGWEGVAPRLRPGDSLRGPPGGAHPARNEYASDARTMVVSAPENHGDRTAAPAGEVAA